MQMSLCSSVQPKVFTATQIIPAPFCHIYFIQPLVLPYHQPVRQKRSAVLHNELRRKRGGEKRAKMCKDADMKHSLPKERVGAEKNGLKDPQGVFCFLLPYCSGTTPFSKILPVSVSVQCSVLSVCTF